jgi:transcriptional regulator with XRE-family HTH domain
MKFKDKLQVMRANKRISQQELADAIGVSRATVSSYEQGKFYPKREIYDKLADFFEVDINYFLTEDEGEVFLAAALEQHGKKGLSKAQALLKETAAMFAGGELSDKDKIAFQRVMQEIFLDAMERSSKV